MGNELKHKGKGDEQSGLKFLVEKTEFKRQLARILPKTLPPERFVRVALTAMQRTPGLIACDQTSFFNALLTLGELGLEPDGRRAHLIPFKNNKKGIVECQLIIDYKGFVDLLTRPGKGNDVSTIHSDIIRENDEFIYDRGIVEKHTYSLKVDRGDPIGAYAIVRFKDGSMKCEVMSKPEIESVKARSKARDEKGNPTGPWKTDELEMWKKTVLRRATKWMPINDQTARALEVDHDRFEPISGIDNPKADAPEAPILEGGSKAIPPWEKECDEMERKKENLEKMGVDPEEFGKQMGDPEDHEPPPMREPGQDDEEEEGSPPEEIDYRAEIFMILKNTHKGNQVAMSDHLKTLTTYKRKDGTKAIGKTSVDKLTDGEAKVTYHKLTDR